jgi:hypothetical protein
VIMGIVKDGISSAGGRVSRSDQLLTTAQAGQWRWSRITGYHVA